MTKLANVLAGTWPLKARYSSMVQDHAFCWSLPPLERTKLKTDGAIDLFFGKLQ